MMMLIFLDLPRISSFSFNLLNNWMNITAFGVVIDLATATDRMPFTTAIPLCTITIIILWDLSCFFISLFLIWTSAFYLDGITTTCFRRWSMIGGRLHDGGRCSTLNLFHHLLLFVLNFHVFEVFPLCQYLHGLNVFNSSELVSIVLVAAE